VANERGLERAAAVGVQKIAVFTAASDTFTRRNINASVRESIERFTPLIARAKQRGMQVRGYVSTVVCCPYEGRIEPARVVGVMDSLLQAGVEEISLGETMGTAAPSDVRRLLDAVMPKIPRPCLALHFHDTYGMGIANALTAWHEYGVRAFDSSAGGLGGCPYASGATGNVATEDLIYALKASGAEVRVDEGAVVDAVMLLSGALGRTLTSRLSMIEHRRAEIPV
jgi:hydroxymethylglutaryl-CoA lyase